MAGEFGWCLIDEIPVTGDIEEVSLNKKPQQWVVYAINTIWHRKKKFSV